MDKKELLQYVDQIEPQLAALSRELWDHPEIAGTEANSVEAYRRLLLENGFDFQPVPEVAHAFIASYGSGTPVIGLLAEYDALPGLSQKCCAHREPVEEGAPGQGCGHNLLGTAALGGALAMKRLLEETGLSGTVRLYGCPAEETLSGKVEMIYHHAFDGCDLSLCWHPMYSNSCLPRAFLANNSLKFHFTGVSAHAAASPHLGRSAVDACELMNIGANYLREHVVERARIHYSTENYGHLPNIVPARASNWYYVRAPYRKDVNEITERLIDIAKGAALMTGTTVEIEPVSGCHELNANMVLTRLSQKNMEEIGAPTFTEEEKKFAADLVATIPESQRVSELASIELSPDSEVTIADYVMTAEQSGRMSVGASSDVGDVSYIMPMQVFLTSCWPVGVTAHSWQAAAAVGSGIGQRGMMFAAKIFAGMCYDLLNDPAIVAAAKAEFQETAKNKPYRSPMEQTYK